SHMFYARSILGGVFPWSIITAGRGVDLFRFRADRSVLPIAEVLLSAWVAAVVAFFTIARFKLDHYIFPVAPACCLLAARGWRAALNDSRMTATRQSVRLMGGAFVGVGVLAALQLSKIDLGLPRGAMVVPIALIFGGAIVVRQTFDRQLAVPRSIWIPVLT